MLVTEKVFEAFLRCETKSYLYSKGALGTNTEFSDWQRHVREQFKQAGWERLRSTVRDSNAASWALLPDTTMQELRSVDRNFGNPH